MHSGYAKAFVIPLALTIFVFTLLWLHDPLAYAQGRPKFIVPFSWSLAASVVVGSFLGALVVLIYHLLRKRD